MPVLQTGLAKSAAEDYTIDQSLRFNLGDSAYLDRTFTAGNRQVFTISVWAKLGQAIEDEYGIGFLSEYTDTNNRTYFRFGNQRSGSPGGSTAGFFLFGKNGGSTVVDLSTNAAYRDPSAWYHVCISVDVTQTTETDRVKIYVNGVQETLGISTMWAEDTDTRINSATVHEVGIPQVGTGFVYGDGYLAEYYFIDGTALDASSFGKTDTATNQWIPLDSDDVKDAVTFGTNGFYQKYAASGPNTFIDSSSSAHTVTAVGDVTNSLIQKKIGTSSIKYDGTLDALNAGDSNDFSFGSGEFTLESWVRFDNVTQSATILAKYDETQTIKEYKFQIHTTGVDYGIEFGYSSDGSTRTWPKFAWQPVVDTWYHVAVSRDSSGDIRAFVDGTQIGSTQNVTDTFYSGTAPLVMGANYNNGSVYSTGNLAGYMDEIRVSDTARYTSNFTPSTTEFVSDSNTMLLIHSDWDGGFGLDSSGNGNDFTPTNLVATDQMVDSPTNNFATLNALRSNESVTITLSEGNLKSSQSSHATILGTIMVNSGKWYAECIWESNISGMCGIGVEDVDKNDWLGESADGIGYYHSGVLYYNNTTLDTYSSYVVDDVIGIALDLDSGTPTVKFYKNNSLEGTENLPAAFIDGSYVTFGVGHSNNGSVMNFGQDSSFAGNLTAQGNQDSNSIGDFYYEPPTDYLALCSSNLPSPEIALPTDHFNTVLWSGDDATSRAITGVGFQPDFSWIKNRTTAVDHILFDSVRGVSTTSTGTEISSNLTTAQPTANNGHIKLFDSDGFSVRDGTSGSNPLTNINKTSANYVAWNWKAGSAPTTDNVEAAGATPTAGSVKIDGSNLGSALAGSIAATRLSANTTNGMSIVTYEGTEAAATVAHGLSQAPELILFKNIDSTLFWPVYNKTIDATDYLQLDATNATRDSDGYFNDTEPTSTVFSLGDKENLNRDTCIAYCFHSVEGYSKVGSYIPVSGTDSSFVYTGFMPSYILSKSSTNTSGWYVLDAERNTYNPLGDYLLPDTSAGEGTYAGFDFCSNGFKDRGFWGSSYSGETMIYLAFAESPFKYSNAR